jgi:hypothetical protein
MQYDWLYICNLARNFEHSVYYFSSNKGEVCGLVRNMMYREIYIEISRIYVYL